MNLLHLQYFYVVAKEGGFLKASEVLRIQQPAISRMVKQLEGSFGFPLFERVGRNVQLTVKGREVFEYSRGIFSAVDKLQAAVGSMNGTAQGVLAFGASEPIASHFVPAVLDGVLRKWPQIYPNVISAPASMLCERIKSGELEFGLFFHLPDISNGLKIEVLKKVRFHLVVRKDLRRQKGVLESFVGSREIDDKATRSFPTLSKLKRLYPEAKIRISSNNLTAHRSMVLRGLGVAVLPDFLIEDDLRSGTLSDVLSDERLLFDLKIVTRSVHVPSINMQSFIDIASKKLSS